MRNFFFKNLKNLIIAIFFCSYSNLFFAQEKIALLVSTKPNDTSENFLAEIYLLETSLQNKGFLVNRVDWQKPNENWLQYSLIVIGDLGQYSDYPQFKLWCQRIKELNIPIQNGAKGLQFYISKSDCTKKLAQFGAPIIPTVLLEKNTDTFPTFLFPHE